MKTVLPLLLSVLLLTGCLFRMESTQTVGIDGSVYTKAVVDFSGVQESVLSIDGIRTDELLKKRKEGIVGLEQPSANPSLEKLCSNIDSTLRVDNARTTCTPLGATSILLTMHHEDIDLHQHEDGTTIYRMHPYHTNSVVIEYAKQKDLMNIHKMQMESWTTSIQMPGIITRADVGTVVAEDTVQLSMISLLKHPDAIIESTVESATQQQPQNTLTPPVIKPEKQARICKRVDRYRSIGGVYTRVNNRIEKRFGFRCDR